METGWTTLVADNLRRPLYWGCRELEADQVTLPPSPPTNWGLAYPFGRRAPAGKSRHPHGCNLVKALAQVFLLKARAIILVGPYPEMVGSLLPRLGSNSGSLRW